MTSSAPSQLLGGTNILGRKIGAASDRVEPTRSGLPVEILPALASELSLDRKAVAQAVGITERTLSRRLGGGPKDWRTTENAALQELGTAWIARRRSIALEVPSVVVEGDWNLLLNPAHPDSPRSPSKNQSPGSSIGECFDDRESRSLLDHVQLELANHRRLRAGEDVEPHPARRNGWKDIDLLVPDRLGRGDALPGGPRPDFN